MVAQDNKKLSLVTLVCWVIFYSSSLEDSYRPYGPSCIDYKRTSSHHPFTCSVLLLNPFYVYMYICFYSSIWRLTTMKCLRHVSSCWSHITLGSPPIGKLYVMCLLLGSGHTKDHCVQWEPLRFGRPKLWQWTENSFETHNQMKPIHATASASTAFEATRP